MPRFLIAGFASAKACFDPDGVTRIDICPENVVLIDAIVLGVARGLPKGRRQTCRHRSLLPQSNRIVERSWPRDSVLAMDLSLEEDGKVSMTSPNEIDEEGVLVSIPFLLA